MLPGPSKTKLREWEKSLEDLGGRKERGDPGPPDQLLVWRPENSGGWDWFDARTWDFCESAATCLKRTQRGDRGFVYQSGHDAAIVAIVDFQSSAYPLLHWGFVAPGVFRPLRRPIPRSALARRRALRNVFGPRLPRRGQNLTDLQTRSIAALVEEELPRFISMPDKECEDEHPEWLRADAEWGRELPMRDAVLDAPKQWRKLFTTRPEKEVSSEDRFDRYDLVSREDRVIAEFKLDATSATLGQLERYLDYRRAQTRRRWSGHIVYGNSCTRTLREAIERRAKRRPGVRLWRCDHGPRLVEE